MSSSIAVVSGAGSTSRSSCSAWRGGDLAGPPDEARELDGEVVGELVQGPKGPEVVGEVGVAQLVDALGPLEPQLQAGGVRALRVRRSLQRSEMRQVRLDRLDRPTVPAEHRPRQRPADRHYHPLDNHQATPGREMPATVRHHPLDNGDAEDAP